MLTLCLNPHSTTEARVLGCDTCVGGRGGGV